MKQILTQITHGEILSREQTHELIRQIVEGKYNDVQISALLMGLIMRGVKVDELLGLRDGLIETGKPVDFKPYKVIDIVGTGGDGKNTFNISTCTCFVVAGAGYKVAKHGNYASTSTSGASNVIERHGVTFTADSERLRRSLEECNFVYLHAPLFARGMKAVAPVRKMLQIPTCFNLLGPLVNPCRPDYQLLGVANLNQMRLYSSVYEKLGIGYGIVNSIDGYDEISLTKDFKVKTNYMEKRFRPADLCLPVTRPEELFGGNTVEEAAEIFDSILENRSTESRKNVVLANAAFAIKVIEKDKDLTACLSVAREALESGKAWECLRKYVELNK
ncbi:MAG: anthranilate phosphoribosyltransferase [Paraprevotella sp.]|nr:anthranilate phosphoribosyltransferase [Paraprevotella sp.]